MGADLSVSILKKDGLKRLYREINEITIPTIPCIRFLSMCFNNQTPMGTPQSEPITNRKATFHCICFQPEPKSKTANVNPERANKGVDF